MKPIWRRRPRLFSLLATLVLVVAAAILTLIVAPETMRAILVKIGGPAALAAKMIPPTLPSKTEIRDAYWLPQNWRGRDRYWFHHATQGTATFPMPYSWFVALEQPGLPRTLFGAKKKIANEDYLRRFGFIPSPPEYPNNPAAGNNYGYGSDPTTAAGGITDLVPAGDYPTNPDRLPVGFARLKVGPNPNTDRLGFTCAACHTGHIEYNNVSIRFDGGPAAINLGELEKATALSLVYTKYLPGRFERFADNVLGEKRQPQDTEALKQRLAALVEAILTRRKWQADILERNSQKDIEEGFGRLDALNRIGNQVFFEAMLPVKDAAKPNAPDPRMPEELAVNFAPADAPVSFPPIWDVSWFRWAQYDASVHNELIRNAGEALGVKALVNLTAKYGITVDPKKKQERFRSSVHIKNIFWMEELLRGGDPFQPAAGQGNPGFKGLHAPQWKDAAKYFAADPGWQVDEKKAAAGRELYRNHCGECHHGPVRDREFDRQWPDESFWSIDPSGQPRRWSPLEGRQFFNNVQKRVAEMGTDPQQARVLTERQVHLPPELGVNPIQYLNEKWQCGIPADDALNRSFVLALMAVVDKTIEQWFNDHPTDAAEKKRMWGPRSNCPNPRGFKAVAQTGGTTSHAIAIPLYRARPLDGIWATGPYLHNGSVPTLHDLLLPQSERPKSFCVGDRQFDPVRVGLKSASQESCAAGLFRFDTSELGNSNRGHSFEGSVTDHKLLPPGVLGRKFTEDEREALIAYLKLL